MIDTRRLALASFAVLSLAIGGCAAEAPREEAVAEQREELLIGGGGTLPTSFACPTPATPSAVCASQMRAMEVAVSRTATSCPNLWLSDVGATWVPLSSSPLDMLTNNQFVLTTEWSWDLGNHVCVYPFENVVRFDLSTGQTMSLFPTGRGLSPFWLSTLANNMCSAMQSAHMTYRAEQFAGAACL